MLNACVTCAKVLEERVLHEEESRSLPKGCFAGIEQGLTVLAQWAVAEPVQQHTAVSM